MFIIFSVSVKQKFLYHSLHTTHLIYCNKVCSGSKLCISLKSESSNPSFGDLHRTLLSPELLLVTLNYIWHDLFYLWCDFFQDNETVRELRLRSNKIGNKGGMAFAQMLQVGSIKDWS